MKFQDKLFTLRKNAGMTQNDLAEKLNVSRQAISRWEMGTAMPDVENLIAISDLFGVTLDALLKDREETTPEGVPIRPTDKSDYMSFVPKYWWWFAVAAVVAKIIPYFLSLAVIGLPNMNVAIVVYAVIGVCNLLHYCGLLATAGCFLYGLFQWRK